MSENPLDLSSLDPTLDRGFDDRVSAIVASARLGASADVADYLSRWTRPALAAAAVIAALSAVPLFHPASSPVAGSTADVLGVPPGLVAIARSSSPPGVADLAEALNVEGNHGR